MTRVFPILPRRRRRSRLRRRGAFAMATAAIARSPGGRRRTGRRDAAGRGCDFRADQMGLDGPARRAFLWRCQQGDASEPARRPSAA